MLLQSGVKTAIARLSDELLAALSCQDVARPPTSKSCLSAEAVDGGEDLAADARSSLNGAWGFGPRTCFMPWICARRGDVDRWNEFYHGAHSDGGCDVLFGASKFKLKGWRGPGQRSEAKRGVGLRLRWESTHLGWIC